MFEMCNNTHNLSVYGYNNSNETTVRITAVSSSLSILGAFGLFWTYYKIPEIRTYVRRLLVVLTVADLLTATGYMLATIRHFAKTKDSISCKLCIIQSFITTYSSLVSFFLTMVIAIHIFLTVYKKRDVTGSRSYMVLFNVISWLAPACIVITALLEKKLGQDVTQDMTSQAGTGPWCWIHTHRSRITDLPSEDTIIWMFLTGKGWEITCYLVTTSLYVLLKFHLYLRHHDVELQHIHHSLRHEDKNFLLVFLVLYAIRIWGTIRFFIFLVGAGNHSEALDKLEKIQAFGDPSQAFFNFCLFCLCDKTVRRYMFTCSKPVDDENKPLVASRNRNVYDSDKKNKSLIKLSSSSQSSTNDEGDDTGRESKRNSVQS